MEASSTPTLNTFCCPPDCIALNIKVLDPNRRSIIEIPIVVRAAIPCAVDFPQELLLLPSRLCRCGLLLRSLIFGRFLCRQLPSPHRFLGRQLLLLLRHLLLGFKAPGLLLSGLNLRLG